MAAFDQGLHAQALPSFGSERTGAPVVAVLPDRRPPDPVARPGRPSRPGGAAGPDPAARPGLSSSAWPTTASSSSTPPARRPSSAGEGSRLRPGQRVVTVPATDLSRELLGRPLPNTALLGAVAAVTGVRGASRPSRARSADGSPARAGERRRRRTSGWPRTLARSWSIQARGCSAMLRQIEGSRAVAETVARCRPHVVAAYPISPQTHIVEALSELVTAGELAPCEYLMVESEFGALSACIGASAAGARAYTATASQGLLFMAEALPNASGLGLPIVMTVANRALGAPINIWNDHSDALSQRDAGWIQLFASSNQEAVDLHVQAFALAERLSLPVMVCMDGFVLTHAIEEIDVPEQDAGRRVPPAVRPAAVARPGRPGHDRRDGRAGGLHRGEVPDGAPPARAPSTTSPRSPTDFAEAFGRDSGGLLRPYRTDDAEVVVVALGSVARLRSRTSWTSCARRVSRSGALGVTCYRPWPVDEVREALRGVPRVIVVNRAVAVGAGSILGQDVRLSAPPAGPRSTTSSSGSVADRSRATASRGWCSTSSPGRLGHDALTLLRPRRDRAAAELARELADALQSGADDDHDTAQALPGRHLRRRQPAARPGPSGPSSPSTDRANSITSGHRACRGCGEALAARVVMDAAMRATGGRLVTVNATGCLEVFSTPFPESAWQVPWLHSLFGNAAAVASGVAAALRATGRDDVRVLAQAGDGGTVDIGLGCLSGMFERNDDVLFVCYDNQGYMNTGVQRSGATPPAPAPPTPGPSATRIGNAFGTGKSLPRIAMAHEIPYVATATVADLHDLEAKVGDGDVDARRALPARARAVPARLGLGRRDTSGSPGSPPRAGCSRSSRPSTARSPACTPIRRRVPVEEYLRLQTRFAHLFAGRGTPRRGRRPAGAGRPRHRPLRAAPRGERHEAPVRRHARPRLQPRRPHRCLAHRARRSTWSGRRPAATRARPARTCRTWLYDAESGGAGYESAWRAHHGDQPVPGRLRPGLLPPVRDRLQPWQPRRGGRDQLRRALPRRRGARRRAGSVTVTAAPTGRRVLVVGSGPAGLSAAYHLVRRGHAVTIRESAPAAGGMMRYGIPRYRLPREVLDAEIDRLLDLGVTLELDTPGHRPGRADGRRGLGRSLPGRRRPAGAPHVPPRRPRPRGSSTPCPCCTGWRRASGRCSAAGSRCTAAATRPSTPPGPPSGWAPPTPSSSTAAPASGCPPTPRRSRRPRRRAWSSTGSRPSTGSSPTGLVIEQMELDEDGFPQPTGRTERLAADSVVLALGQDTDLSFLGRRRRPPGLRRHVDTDSAFATDPHRRLRRRRRGRGGALGHDRHRARSPRGREHRRLAGRASARTRPCGRPGAVRGPQHLVLRGRRPHPPASASSWPGAARRSTRWCTASTRDTALYEARRCLSCGSCFSCDNCYALVPGQRRHQARPARRVRHRPRLLQGLRAVRRGVPGRRDRHGARGDLRPAPCQDRGSCQSPGGAVTFGPDASARVGRKWE